MTNEHWQWGYFSFLLLAGEIPWKRRCTQTCIRFSYTPAYYVQGLQLKITMMRPLKKIAQQKRTDMRRRDEERERDRELRRFKFIRHFRRHVSTISHGLLTFDGQKLVGVSSGANALIHTATNTIFMYSSYEYFGENNWAFIFYDVWYKTVFFVIQKENVKICEFHWWLSTRKNTQRRWSWVEQRTVMRLLTHPV